VTTNVAALCAEPAGVVTWMRPLLAPNGTVARMVDDETTVNGMLKKPIRTAVAPLRDEPVIVTSVPGGPELGVSEEIDGGRLAVTVKATLLTAVPAAVCTRMGPVEAKPGTVAFTRPSVMPAKAALTPLKLTLSGEVSPVPLMLTLVPGGPLVGVNEVMVGIGPLATMKFVELVPVPLGELTRIGPLTAAGGTTAVSKAAEETVKVAGTPPNWTLVALPKLPPLTVTLVPGPPLVGKNEVTTGAMNAVTVKLDELVAVPAEVKTVIGPLAAKPGTVAITWFGPSVVKAALTPPKATLVVPPRLTPEIVTCVVGGPLVGVNDAMTGSACVVTTKLPPLVAVPCGVVIAIGPVTTPNGAVVVNVDGLCTAKVAGTPPNRTLVAPEKLAPKTVTPVPA
jgi:hypothetical protein